MFIFSQFNFPDPKPPDSEGDWRVPERLGVRAAVTQEQKEGREGFPEEEGEESEPKGALEAEWRVRFIFTTGSL